MKARCTSLVIFSRTIFSRVVGIFVGPLRSYRIWTQGKRVTIWKQTNTATNTCFGLHGACSSIIHRHTPASTSTPPFGVIESTLKSALCSSKYYGMGESKCGYHVFLLADFDLSADLGLTSPFFTVSSSAPLRERFNRRPNCNIVGR